MQTVTLNNGTKMPAIGLGLWKVKNKTDCMNEVRYGLRAGYRHFDTAQIYGNEAFLGEALASSGIARNKLFITTKIWNDNQGWDGLINSFTESLANLQTDYVDLLLLHFPVTEYRRPAWRRIEELARGNRVRAVGVSNYTIRHLEELLKEGTIVPAVNQVELHVYLQQPELVEFCKSHNILVEAYSPLAHGYGLDNSILAGIGKKYGKSPAQVMIRWCIEMGTVPLPKSIHANRIEENNNVFDFKLNAEDLALLKNLESDFRTCWDPTHVA